MQQLGPLKLRVLLAALYIGVPNVAKVHGNLANTQWHLAVLSFLVLIAPPPRSIVAKVFDVSALVLGALTGPFGVLLLPVALMVAAVRRERWRIGQIAILSVGAVIQGDHVAALRQATHAGRTGRFLVAPLPDIGVPDFRSGVSGDEPQRGICATAPVIVGPELCAHCTRTDGTDYVFVRGSLEIRCMLVFAAVVLAASLASPLATPNGLQWEALQQPGSTHRYWYLPELAVAAAVVWIASASRHRLLRIAGAVAVCIILMTDAAYWRLPPLPDMHFETYAAAFQALPVGSAMRIPINPDGWFVELTKTRRDGMAHSAGDGK